MRQACFPGASADLYKALKTSLRAEIDKSIWETLCSETSRPFPGQQLGAGRIKDNRQQRQQGNLSKETCARNDHGAWPCDASLSTSQTGSLSCDASDTAFCHTIPVFLRCYEKGYRGASLIPQRSTNPRCIMASAGRNCRGRRQGRQQTGRSGILTDGTGCQQYSNQTPRGITDCMEPGVQFALCSSDTSRSIPFFSGVRQCCELSGSIDQHRREAS